jgi:1,2-phenylacetyl-CoA epoxidase catalytic subunit
MNEEATRVEATAEHRAKCQEKLNVLLDQKNDMFVSISQLIEDIEAGDKYMKAYKQMKMYNDEELNPVLYQNKK